MARRRSGLILTANRQRLCRQGISTSRPHFGNDGCENREPTGLRRRCARVCNTVEQSCIADNEHKNNDSAGAPQSRHPQARLRASTQPPGELQFEGNVLKKRAALLVGVSGLLGY